MVRNICFILLLLYLPLQENERFFPKDDKDGVTLDKKNFISETLAITTLRQPTKFQKFTKNERQSPKDFRHITTNSTIFHQSNQMKCYVN